MKSLVVAEGLAICVSVTEYRTVHNAGVHATPKVSPLKFT